MQREYDQSGGRSYVIDDGQPTLLANFAAVITEEIRQIDGDQVETTLKIAGYQMREEERIELPEVSVPAKDFPGMSWVMQFWGVMAVVQPGAGVKDDLRTSIQLASRPKRTNIHKSMGWAHDAAGNAAYLHATGAITEAGNDPSVLVSLPAELQRYDLTKATTTPRDGLLATLKLINLTPPDISWVLLATTLAPLMGQVDFATHIAGRTGTFKSELASLWQSHYGPTLDARHLPASWSSTPNALEALSYYAANALIVIDDFIPSGTSWQVRNYHTTAEKIIRAQGNQAGRARLTDTSHLQHTMHPRGVILSTGEDVPEGHSVRARMMILELRPGDIDTTKLTECQDDRDKYTATTIAMIQSLIKQPHNTQDAVDGQRSTYVGIGHNRTPSMIARMIDVADLFVTLCLSKRAIGQAQAAKLREDSKAAIIGAGKNQAQFLENADPVDIFLNGLRHVLQAGLAHLRTCNGGIPRSPTLFGWTEQNTGQDDFPTYKSNGPCIGWVALDDDAMYLEATTGFNVVRKHVVNELPQTRQTIYKRLKEAGAITKSDDARQRTTTRVTCEAAGRTVIQLSISAVLQREEAV